MGLAKQQLFESAAAHGLISRRGARSRTVPCGSALANRFLSSLGIKSRDGVKEMLERRGDADDRGRRRRGG